MFEKLQSKSFEIINVRKVFIDTNVFDDLFADGLAAKEIEVILEFIKRGELIGCTSSKTLMDIHYLFQSTGSTALANKRIKQVYAIMEIVGQGAAEVKDAFALGWTDFEDSMQMASALNAKCDKIITLDKKFRNKDKAYIWTPSDLCSYLMQNRIK